MIKKVFMQANESVVIDAQPTQLMKGCIYDLPAALAYGLAKKWLPRGDKSYPVALLMDEDGNILTPGLRLIEDKHLMEAGQCRGVPIIGPCVKVRMIRAESFSVQPGNTIMHLGRNEIIDLPEDIADAFIEMGSAESVELNEED